MSDDNEKYIDDDALAVTLACIFMHLPRDKNDTFEMYQRCISATWRLTGPEHDKVVCRFARKLIAYAREYSATLVDAENLACMIEISEANIEIIEKGNTYETGECARRIICAFDYGDDDVAAYEFMACQIYETMIEVSQDNYTIFD